MRDKQFCDGRGMAVDNIGIVSSGGRYSTRDSQQRSNRDNSGPWSSNNRPHPQAMVMGVNISQLVDRLCNPRNDLEQELETAYKKNTEFFECDKGSTTVLTAAARQRNIQLANHYWAWMDRRQLKKNTFHYNSMISATEKGKQYKRTLELLKEMTDQKIAKNEVTYVLFLLFLLSNT